MLVLGDRNFYSYPAWCQAVATGAALLWRVSASLTLPVLAWLPDGSFRSVLITDGPWSAPRAAVAEPGEPGPRPAMLVRVVEYMIDNRPGGGELFCLITTLVDHEFAAAVSPPRRTHSVGRSSCPRRDRNPPDRG